MPFRRLRAIVYNTWIVWHAVLFFYYKNSNNNSNTKRQLHLVVDALIVCHTDRECQEAYLPASKCIDGTCTNPFYKQGCLANLPPPTAEATEATPRQRRRPMRTCHSEDPYPAAAIQGHCREPDPYLDYTEVRILTQDWESVFLEAWILQIILTEVLGVPATIESGTPHVQLDFYRPNVTRGYGKAYDWPALERAQTYQDCRMVPQYTDVDDDDDDDGNKRRYQSCAHVLPEVYVNHLKKVDEFVQQGTLLAPTSLGALGQQAWFVPKFTAQRDPTLVSTFGLQGQRHKLANRFGRPTRFGDYCREVSPTQCRVPDNVTARPPMKDTVEAERFFVPNGIYQGHFRQTEENDCDTHPDTCTGHIADFPCGWLSTVEQQAYHLDIALRSSGPEPGSRGYPYKDLLDMMAAANATKSDFIMQWWTPDYLYQQYLGTDAELMRVYLPPPTLECVQHTILRQDRCASDKATRTGDARGACMEPPNLIQKVMVQALRDEYLQDAHQAQSPAYPFLENFKLSALEIEDMFDKWLDRGVDSDFDMRYAACQWVTEHWEQVQLMIPDTFPRTTRDDAAYEHNVLFYVATVLSGSALVGVVVTGIRTCQQRQRRVMKFAQIEFLWLLLGGLFLVACGALLALQPARHDGTCVLTIWLINFGYTLEFVPLIVKVAAIGKLMAAADRLRRVVLDRMRLFRIVAGLCAIMAVYLTVWTILDPPRQGTILSLTDDVTAFGETIVFAKSYCQSNWAAWRYVAMTWHFLLLLSATVLAFQTRQIRTEFNESRELSRLIYSQFICAVLRVITYSFDTERTYAEILRFQSLIYSIDILNALAIYFWSKLVKKDEEVTSGGGLPTAVSGLNISKYESSRILAQMREASASSHSASCNHDQSGILEETESSTNLNSVQSSPQVHCTCGAILNHDYATREVGTMPVIAEGPELGSLRSSLDFRSHGSQISVKSDDQTLMPGESQRTIVELRESVLSNELQDGTEKTSESSP